MWQDSDIIGTQLSFGIMAILNLSLEGAENARLLALCERDVRFVAAKSLTQTAQEVQSAVRQHIREAFVLRRPNFEKSVKIRPATKQILQAEVYTMAGFATLQQAGGRQTAKSGQLAVPRYDDLKQVKAGRKSNAAGSFLLKLKSGGHAIASRANGEFRILYYLKNLAYNPKRLNMLEIGEEVSIRRFPLIFRDNLRAIP
jgi:hypothetical protein